MFRIKIFALLITTCFTTVVIGEDDSPITLKTVEKPVEISPDEPLRKEYSAKLAARSLDTSALSWQKRRKCGTCHTNVAYLMARPSLKKLSPPSKEVRHFFEKMVEKRWVDIGPRWDAEVVVTASHLAANDKLTTGKLSPITKKAFQRMWEIQQEDGSWDWLLCGWPPMESDPHYGVTIAAIGVGMAPDRYAKSEEAKNGIAAIKKYLKNNPPPSLHHQAMVLWASTQLDGLMTKEEQEKALNELLALQLPDGGWATAHFFKGWKGHKRKDDLKQELNKSDGYGTGFVVYVARQAGIPAKDKRLQKAIQWLKTNQRESGRWFTPSPTKDSKHLITNFGTAFAVMAIEACEKRSFFNL